MLNTFDLLTESENERQTNELSQMAENNTSVDIPALVNRINQLETAVRELQSKETAKTETAETETAETETAETEMGFPINGNSEERESK